MDKLLESALSQGIWAALSVVLIFYILKQQEKRDLNHLFWNIRTNCTGFVVPKHQILMIGKIYIRK